MYEKLLKKFLSLKQFLKINELKVLIFLVIIFIIRVALPFLPNNKTFVFINIITIVLYVITLIAILYIKLKQNKTLWRKIWTIPYRRFLRRDIFDQCIITIFIVTSIVALTFHFYNKPLYTLIAYAIIILISFLSGFWQWKKYKDEKKKLFGNDYENKSNNNIIATLRSEMYKIFAKVVLLPIACVILFMSIYIYIPIFDKVIISDDTSDWGAFGDYIGSILTFITIAATLFMIYMQQKQINKSKEEFRQEQFRTTFEYLFEKIEKDMNNIKNNEITKQFYQLLKIISQEIYEYSNKNSNIQNKYIFIFKTYLSTSILQKIFSDKNIIDCDENDNNNLYVNIKNIVDKYSFFEYLHLSDIDNAEIELNNVTFRDKDTYFKKYKISAFEGNDELMSHRIDLEQDNKAFDEYAEHHSIKVRQSVAKNEFTSINTLKFLSEDEKAEVRQAVAGNENTPQDTLKQLANDNEKEVRQAVISNKKTPIELVAELLEKEKYCDNFCSLVIKREELLTNNLNNILKNHNKYIEEIMEHQNTDCTTYNLALDIIEQKNDNLLFVNLLRRPKLYQYNSLVKRCVYLCFDKYKFKCMPNKFEHNEHIIVIDYIFQYLKENNIDNDIFNNLCNKYILMVKKYSGGKLNYPIENIQEKINQTKLTDEQKEQLLDIFIDKKQTNDPN